MLSAIMSFAPLEEKKEQVIGSIEEQGKLTDELKEKILSAETLVVVEDLYRPYRPKRKTRASVAKEKGLDGLAEWILAQDAKYPLEEDGCNHFLFQKTEDSFLRRHDFYRQDFFAFPTV